MGPSQSIPEAFGTLKDATGEVQAREESATATLERYSDELLGPETRFVRGGPVQGIRRVPRG